jgi:copper chaperone NosL
MIISDERFASAQVDKDGNALKFDDVGCMVLHGQGLDDPSRSCWVRDASRPGWLNARDATYVHAPGITSPMGHGLAAVVSSDAAEALAQGPAARRFRFDQLTAFVTKKQSEAAGPDAESERPRILDLSSRQELNP